MKLHQFTTARGAIAIRSYGAKPQHGRRIIRAIAVVLAMALGAFLAQPAKAQGEAYSPRLAAERREAIRSVILTRNCMFDAAQALMLQGVVKREALEVFAASACGSRMRVFLVGIAKWSPEDAEALIKAFAAKEVESALSWGR